MIQTKEETGTISTKVALTCDKCHKSYNYSEHWDEIQEFHHIRFTSGYGSVFGDMEKVECDICQHCLFEFIKDYMRTLTVYPGEITCQKISPRRPTQPAEAIK